MRRKLVRLHMLEDRPSFEGVLVGRRAGHYVLENARVAAAEGQAVPLDGTIYVRYELVLFVQAIR